MPVDASWPHCTQETIPISLRPLSEYDKQDQSLDVTWLPETFKSFNIEAPSNSGKNALDRLQLKTDS